MKNKCFLLLGFSLLFLIDSLFTCTVFGRFDESIEIGKNLDWEIDDGLIFINNRAEQKESIKLPNKEVLQWKSKYGSITFNQFGKNLPLGGMNECGLVIEELSYSPTKYPENNKKSITELQWIQYNLDNFSTTKEVISNLSELSIIKFMFGLHYFVCDNFGDVAIIEFINNEIRCYNGNEIIVPVLSNNTYENSLRNLKNYTGYGGELMLKDSEDSMTRFVRTSNLLLANENSFSILDSVKQDDTQWSIVYSVSSKQISYKTRRYSRIKMIKFEDFMFCNNTKSFIELNSDSIVHKTYNNSIEQNSLQRIFDKLINIELFTEEKNSELLDIITGTLEK